MRQFVVGLVRGDGAHDRDGGIAETTTLDEAVESASRFVGPGFGAREKKHLCQAACEFERSELRVARPEVEARPQ